MRARERPAAGLRTWTAVIGTPLIVLVICFVFGVRGPLAVILPVGSALSIAAWAVFQLRKERSERESELATWAASEAVLAERLRIARQFHDIVSHGLGMITVRASTARYLQARSPSQGELLEALEDVESTSRQATIELRRMLETLRETTEPGPRHPTDSLESLPGIVAEVERAGLQVEILGEPLGTVSPGVQLAVCVIVREGLANAARHAGSTRAQVILAREHDVVTVAVVDDGPAADWVAAEGAGHGLIGLRERVNGLGGTLQAGPNGNGYRLEARLPETTA